MTPAGREALRLASYTAGAILAIAASILAAAAAVEMIRNGASAVSIRALAGAGAAAGFAATIACAGRTVPDDREERAARAATRHSPADP
jgi:hypothetical protein